MKLKDEIYKIHHDKSTVDAMRILHEDVWPIDELTALFERMCLEVIGEDNQENDFYGQRKTLKYLIEGEKA